MKSLQHKKSNTATRAVANRNQKGQGRGTVAMDTVQRMEEDELMQGKLVDPLQREGLDEEELMQGKFEDTAQMKAEDALQREEFDEEELQGKFKEPVQREEADGMKNETGMPDNLKSGLENLSGMDMSDVRVHYNSSKPAAVQAHAYAQGSDIHVGPGQEQHLPHESWHVAQQKAGRVEPTTEVNGMAVNDDPGLEKEADVMGAKAAQFNRK